MTRSKHKKRVRRTERGWAGHFICASTCLYRRNTLLECGGTRIVISTVGNMREPNGYPDSKTDTIGHNRFYETMAFHAHFESPYWEADVKRQVHFESEWSISECERVTDLRADEMHEAVVAEITARLKNGEKF